jgi:hypothetical protein
VRRRGREGHLIFAFVNPFLQSLIPSRDPSPGIHKSYTYKQAGYWLGVLNLRAWIPSLIGKYPTTCVKAGLNVLNDIQLNLRSRTFDA